MVSSCVICDSQDLTSKEQLARDGDRLLIYKCGNCLHQFQDPDIYQDMYSSGDFTSSARGEKTPTKEKIQQLDRMAFRRYKAYFDFIKEFGHTLEIGSSIGSFLHILKLMGKTVQGIEPDSDYAHFSEHQYGFTQLPELLENHIPTLPYDAVCSFHVIEHVQDPKAFVRNIREIMKEGGKLLIECPSIEINTYGVSSHTYWKPHIHYFSLASIYHLVANAFRVLEVNFIGNFLFIKAVNDGHSFDEKEFRTVRSRTSRTAKLIKLLPAPRTFKKIPVKQLLLQPWMEKSLARTIKSYVKLVSFGIQEKNYLRQEKQGGKPPAVHISYFGGWENAGDTVLSKCVRQVFNLNLKNGWELQKLTHRVDNALIEKINSSRYLLIGGGGVFIPDSNPNQISGWQWPASKEQIAAIEKPIIIFAVGYNYFPGQEANSLFVDNISYLLEKANFFGLRNMGSINMINELTQNQYKDKISFQPCPTTIIRHSFPKLSKKVASRNVAVNIAFDRYERRFGKDVYIILDQIALALKEISNMGFKIYNASHLKDDLRFEISLKKHQVAYENKLLQHALPLEVFDFYNNMEVVLGVRGHAQMIPFGVNCKIITLGSHNKMRYFLEDIDSLDWYVNLKEEPTTIKDRILSVFNEIQLENPKVALDRIFSQQARLLQITEENLEVIKSIVS